MIEIVVTMFVMAVGLLGMAALQSQAVKNGFDTGQRSQAIWLVNEIVDRMRANPSGWSDYIDSANGDFCAVPSKECSDHSSGSAQVAASNCSASEMAAFDVWEVFCGRTIGTSKANAVDTVTITDISMTCGGSACNAGDVIDVKIDFTSKSVADSTVGAEDRTQSIQFSVRPAP